MRILFASGQGGGHFGPLVPFARAAQRAGHDILVAAPGSARGMVERAGFAFHALGEAWDREARWAPVFNGNGPGAAHVVQELFIALDARAALPGMLALVHNDRPDLIVRETTEFASCIAAAHFDVPVVDVSPHLDAAIDTDQGLRALAEPALEQLGPFRLDAPVITLSPFGDTNSVTRFRHPAQPPQDDSLVYVSFGSEIREPHLFRTTAHALEDVPKRVLMTLGRHVDPDALGPLPANVRVEPWIDQGAVLPHAAAVVGHGGSGGTLAALAAGVPIAFLPQFVDGPANADRIAELGAGIVATDIAKAIRELLDDPTYRDAAQRVASEIRALPPVDGAVELFTNMRRRRTQRR
jgi:UDP:flavonoid glycosyltransferase YjiC (YdhE family)